MNFNKKVKGFFISSLFAIVAVCGVAFGITYKSAAVKAADGNGVIVAASELSADVKAVYDAFNDAPLISGNSNQSDYYTAYRNAYKVEYVKDATINGATVSGLRFTVDTNLSNKRITVIQPRYLNIDTSSLSWNTPLFGFMMESRENKTSTAFELGPTLIDEDGQGFRLKIYESDIANGERSAIRAYVVNNDYNTMDGGTNVGGYYGPSYVYSTTVRKWVGNNYVDTFAESATKPFNFYYDNATNVAYCDAAGEGSNIGWHLIRMFSEDPANYGNHSSPFPTESGKSYGTGSGEAVKFLGFKNNSARLGIRLIHGEGVGKYSFILTSYAGLDLTDPGNTLNPSTDNYGVTTENRTLAVKDGSSLVAKVNVTTKIPELCYKNRITGDVMDGEFVGTVNVYKGVRSSKSIEYSAYGASVDISELGEALATEVSAGSEYTFDETGCYTLVYNAESGATKIVEINVVEDAYSLRINAFNAKLTDENGTVLGDGCFVYSGQTVKVVPNDGYTLYGMGGVANAILVGDKENSANKNAYGNYKTLTDGAYVIQDSDESTVETGVIDIGIAAYKEKYNIKFIKNNAEDGNNLSDYRNIEIYKGVPAGYSVDGRLYCVYNPTVFKPTSGVARWNNNFGWDGERLLLSSSYNWPYSTDANDPYKAVQPFGYKITYGEGSAQKSSIYKIGGNWYPVIDSDVTIEAAFIRSFVDYKTAKIETDGTIGLSVKLGISKPDYDRLIRMAEGDDIALDFYAVVTTGETLDGLKDYRKDAYHVTTDSKNFVKTKLNRENLVTETINGKEYYVFNVKGVNIPKENYAKDYVFGGYVAFSSYNGGQVVRFGQGGEEFEKINVYAAAKNTFGAGSSVINTDSGTYSREINGLTYYSDTLTSRGIYFAVKYYYIGAYLTYVTETETEGYRSIDVNGKTYWYSVDAPSDIERAIKFYNGISLAEEA